MNSLLIERNEIINQSGNFAVRVTNKYSAKFVLRMLSYLENKNPVIFRGLVDDNFAPCASELASLGVLSDDWYVNKFVNLKMIDEKIKEVILGELDQRILEVQKMYKEKGINIIFLEDGVGPNFSEIVDPGIYFSIESSAEKTKMFGSSMKSGDNIFGFASSGKSIWEESFKSGLESNGIFSAQQCLLSEKYNSFFDDKDLGFKGKFSLNDRPPILKGASVEEALTSSPRHYALVIKTLIKALRKSGSLDFIHGVVLNTNYGITRLRYLKVSEYGSSLKFFYQTLKGQKIPSILSLVQKESLFDWEEMSQLYSGGIGVMIIGEKTMPFQKALKETEKNCGVKLYYLGDVFPNSSNDCHSITVSTPEGTIVL